MLNQRALEKGTKTYLQRWNKERIDQIKVAINGFWMDGMMFLLLAGFTNHLNRFDAMILFVAPIDDPYLVEMFDVKDVHRVSIRHDDLGHQSKESNNKKTANDHHCQKLQLKRV